MRTLSKAIALSVLTLSLGVGAAQAEGTVRTEPPRLHVSWGSFEKDTHILAEILKKQGPFKGMVAITRGGMVPATILAHDLNIRKIDTISISSYGDDDKRGKINVLKSAPELGDGQGWLVVDDLSDSGATLRAVRKIFPKAHVAVVYTKPNGADVVDSYVSEIDQKTWIVFPWEES